MEWVDVTGKTSATYSNPPVSSITTFNNGQLTVYRCVVTRNSKTSNSEGAAVLAPVIGEQPTGGALNYGDGLSMIAAADQVPDGSTYQWYKGGVAIVGASGSISAEGEGITYDVTAVAAGDAGNYTLVVTAAN